MQELTPRLAAVAGFVLRGEPMADIGTDHAHLPVALVAAGAVPRAVATDLRPGPLAAARQAVAAAGLAARIELRLGSGLTVLRPGEVACVVMAGMGGALIADLLAAAPAVLAGLRRLVLQPMAGEEGLRRRLPALGWRIADEALAAEGGRIYPIVVAEPAGGPAVADAHAAGAAAAAADAGSPAGVAAGASASTADEEAELDALLGPVLRRRGGALFVAYAQGIAARLAGAARAAERARSDEGRARGEALRVRAERVRKAAEEAGR